MEALTRIESNCVVQPGPLATPCKVWQGVKSARGYGRVHYMGKKCQVHRVAYELARGPIPLGLELDHLCSNRACCAPEHLEPVTHEENVRRGSRAQKTLCSKGHPLDRVNATSGSRYCSTCQRAHARAWRARRKEAA